MKLRSLRLRIAWLALLAMLLDPVAGTLARATTAPQPMELAMRAAVCSAGGMHQAPGEPAHETDCRMCGTCGCASGAAAPPAASHGALHAPSRRAIAGLRAHPMPVVNGFWPAARSRAPPVSA